MRVCACTCVRACMRACVCLFVWQCACICLNGWMSCMHACIFLIAAINNCLHDLESTASLLINTDGLDRLLRLCKINSNCNGISQTLQLTSSTFHLPVENAFSIFIQAPFLLP